MRLSKFSTPFLGFLQSTGLFVYTMLIGLFFAYANKIFGPVDTLFSPIAFLLLFVVSAVISSSLVLARAGYLFWERRYKEAFSLLLWTIIWTIFYLVSVFTIIYFSK